MKKFNLKIVDSKNIYGTMNSGSVKLTNITDSDKTMLMNLHNLSNVEDLETLELSGKDKAMIFKNHRQALGKAEGFDGNLMYMADQKTKNGSYFEITRDYVEANPKGWSDIDEDILIVTDRVPGVVIGHPVADCPVIIMEDKKIGVTAMAHCSCELIDKKMPMMIADALNKAFDSKDEDIIAYISACAGDSWTYDSYPKWAGDTEMWKSGIEVDDNGKFCINLRNVIKNQMQERNINKVFYNMNDTITNRDYYSNNAASPYGLNDQSKFGRNFEGAFYTDESNSKTR